MGMQLPGAAGMGGGEKGKAGWCGEKGGARGGADLQGGRVGSAAGGRCLLPLDSLCWAKQLVRNKNKHQGYRFLLLTASNRQRKTPNKYN